MSMRSARSCFFGQGRCSFSHQMSARCMMMLNCTGLMPRRPCACIRSEGTMQKPRSMTGLPYFFSEDLRVSVFGVIGTTTDDGPALIGLTGVGLMVVGGFFVKIGRASCRERGCQLV